jgi:hypothetical protein
MRSTALAGVSPVSVIVVSPSPQRAILAALLLQERGYSRVLLLRD